MALIELKNVEKIFPQKKGFMGKSSAAVRAVDHVSLLIHEGENLSLVGESGCGKTTLARIIMKLMKATAGDIIFEGENVSKIEGGTLKTYRENVQMVFQDPFNSLDPRFNIRSILKEPMVLDKLKFKTESAQEKRICSLMKAVDLKEEMLNRFPHEFSGGERQRIAIARALVMNPKMIILDEAVSSLDVIIQEQILDLLKQLQDQFGLTYLFISHNLKVVKKISHRIAVMFRGKIIELAPTDELIKNPLHPYTKELLSAAIHYKSVSKDQDFSIDPESKLIDQGEGHFLLS